MATPFIKLRNVTPHHVGRDCVNSTRGSPRSGLPDFVASRPLRQAQDRHVGLKADLQSLRRGFRHLLAQVLWLIFLLLAPCTPAFAQAEDTEQLIQQGKQAFKAGHTEQAGLIFERILLEQPWRQGVWLDYALCLQQLGDNDSARAIFKSVLAQNPPEHLVPWLKQQIQSISRPIEDWQYSGAVTLLDGHDNNLNRAPLTNYLTLTLPLGGLAVLPLSSSSQANAGASQLMHLDWQAVRQSATNGDWLVQATLNTRQTPGNDGQGYLQSGIGLSHNWIAPSAQEYRTVLTVQDLQYGGIDLQRTLRTGLYQVQHWQKPNAKTACTSSYGAEWELISYPSSSELNGQYLGIAADLGCKQSPAWHLLLRTGIDMAQSSRPGADQQSIDLRGQLGDYLGAGRWLALGELTLLHDTSGYSPLLDNNAVRNIQNLLLKLEYQHPLGPKLQAVVSTEIFRQSSNLPLFTLSGKAAWLGARYLF